MSTNGLCVCLWLFDNEFAMNNILKFVVRSGSLLLVGIVFLEQIGLPLPSHPFLLATGALAEKGEMNGLMALAVATLAALLADGIWFYLIRARGNRVLNLACRISLEPDSCGRRTEGVFVWRGVGGIVTAKFLPGLGTLMPPVAAT